MKLQQIARAVVALSAAIIAPAYATELVTIPASIAIPASTNPDNDCYVEAAVGFVAEAAFGFCQVDFPLTIPSGHTIKQISVIHGDKNFYGDPFVYAFLAFTHIGVPYDTASTFYKESHVPLIYPAVQGMPLMAQIGKLFPDSFVVQPGAIYHVIVHLERGTTVEGIQVIYE